MRRFGEPVISGQKYTVRPGVYVILPRQGRLLLTKQDGEVQLPGGGIDRGESPLQALHREVFEETGWRIADPLKVGVYQRFCYMPDYDLWAKKVCHIYIARPILKLGAPTELGHQAVWVEKALAEIVLANSGDRAFVASL
ncbi:NUDIX hydrolase [Marivivens sp. LCG002]|uniref:NUDIX hydrolase n=1 Tax=Marivivens sp. LCG002 TaxID=3051171 RepID=UPI002554AC1F|nr:NUDIX hydrolase [Marivivens sp. LCG002]WIV50774.1 NUDIX hydrolase [Marivivens sp. LCG002]